ncbi:hypothetical protein Cgig2_013955 [Carnegiea gigantea]|uniref:Chlororespiratory reduction 21 n=1 Tax=Carnegiea gigantea TaxID=171969 RepID=A0A9Q1QQ70_9CARY|nr:hypothetical protein Cgig2_013955 [Carnegiea gigantea]
MLSLRNKQRIPKALFLHFSSSDFTPLLRCNHLCNPLFSRASTACPDISLSQNSSKVVNNEISLIKSLIRTCKFLQSLFLFKKFCPSASISSFSADPSAFPFLIRSCASVSHLDFGICLHGYLTKCGFMSCFDISTSLIAMYLKFGNNVGAYQLFEEMPSRDKKFGSGRFFEETLLLFEEMLALDLLPCLEAVRLAVVACGELSRLDKWQWLQSFIIDYGLDRNPLIGNSLISMYIKMERLDLACCTFDAMEERDLVSWNSLITGHAQAKNWADALNVYLTMKDHGNIIHNNVTLLGLVVACSQAGYLEQGRTIHGHCVRAGLLSDFRLGTAILDMYAKCGSIESAEMLFGEGVFEKSLVSWNSLISGYSKTGYNHKAVILFKNISAYSNLKPDSITLANVIPAYSGLGRLEGIRSIHAVILKKGLEMGADVVLGTSLVDAYGKCSDVEAAENLFACIKGADTPTWNSMLTAYYLNDNVHQGMLLFLKMLRSQVLPDTVTVVLLLQMCGQLGSLKQGSMAHGYSLTKGFSSHLKIENAVLDMYMRCSSVEASEQLFRLMNMKNIVTWNTMLSGYVKIASHSTTMILFSQMQLESVCRPDSVTLICLIQSSAALLGGHGAEVAHVFVLKLGFASATMVVNSLMDAYAKSGIIEDASSLFVHMGQTRDQCSWNVMIAACGMNGQGEKACELLKEMNEDGYEPDSVTFTSLLSACSHSGMIEEGCRYFDLMINKYNIHPDLEHWTCIIDMFGRAGRLEEAYQLIKYSLNRNRFGVIPSDSGAIWGAFLEACRMYKNIELGELAGKKLLQLSPQNSGYPILLSDLYASTMRWDEVLKVRQVLNDRRLVKEPGFSSVKT